ncbi:integrator complex subunit 10 [Anopheles bellator]|uniref:integrator complex subunit 10 n=1 Tax=Anopheles bellator TaxID=139047 RepID=UPI0026485C8D|nr:integrator complex subunit 10 [Anopheles bellator]
MDVLSNEKYLIARAKESSDPYKAKAWIIAAKTLFPNDFGVQFEAYEIEKNANNFEEAAKCLSYIVMTFHGAHQTPSNLLNEISLMTNALRIPEGCATPEQEFYVKMFQYISYEVQHQILLLTAAHSNNNLDHCRLILLLLKRFPQAISTHAPRLLETLIQNVSMPSFTEMLFNEAIPLVYNRVPDLAPKHVHRLLAVCLEYYLSQMLGTECGDDRSRSTADCWKKIFDILDFCGKILKWEPFVLYKKNWSKDVYWQKIIHIYKLDPFGSTESKQILFCATFVFVLALQEYIGHSRLRSKDGTAETEVILVEALKDVPVLPDRKRHALEGVLEIPHILVTSPVSVDAPNCLIACHSCWQLLHSNECTKSDFAQLILCLPQLSGWVQKFLIDLYVCVGQHDETATLLLSPNMSMGSLEKAVRQFALTLAQGPITVHLFEQIGTILKHLPQAPLGGSYLESAVSHSQAARVLMLIPLTKRAILHYLVQTLIAVLKPNLVDPECSHSVLGNLLVLSQLNWPHESTTVEIIFEIIKSRRQFSYFLFTGYIVNAEIIEEFMHLWTHSPDVKLELAMPQQSLATGARRIGTRGADKGVKEDFKQIIRQQIARSNDDVDELIMQFLQQQHMALVQNVFDK